MKKKKTKKNAFNELVYDFSVDYNTIDIIDIVDIHKSLMQKHIMPGFIK